MQAARCSPDKLLDHRRRHQHAERDRAGRGCLGNDLPPAAPPSPSPSSPVPARSASWSTTATDLYGHRHGADHHRQRRLRGHPERQPGAKRHSQPGAGHRELHTRASRPLRLRDRRRHAEDGSPFTVTVTAYDAYGNVERLRRSGDALGEHRGIGRLLRLDRFRQRRRGSGRHPDQGGRRRLPRGQRWPREQRQRQPDSATPPPPMQAARCSPDKLLDHRRRHQHAERDRAGRGCLRQRPPTGGAAVTITQLSGTARSASWSTTATAPIRPPSWRRPPPAAASSWPP